MDSRHRMTDKEHDEWLQMMAYARKIRRKRRAEREKEEEARKYAQARLPPPRPRVIRRPEDDGSAVMNWVTALTGVAGTAAVGALAAGRAGVELPRAERNYDLRREVPGGTRADSAESAADQLRQENRLSHEEQVLLNQSEAERRERRLQDIAESYSRDRIPPMSPGRRTYGSPRAQSPPPSPGVRSYAQVAARLEAARALPDDPQFHEILFQNVSRRLPGVDAQSVDAIATNVADRVAAEIPEEKYDANVVHDQNQATESWTAWGKRLARETGDTVMRMVLEDFGAIVVPALVMASGGAGTAIPIPFSAGGGALPYRASLARLRRHTLRHKTTRAKRRTTAATTTGKHKSKSSSTRRLSATKRSKRTTTNKTTRRSSHTKHFRR